MKALKIIVILALVYVGIVVAFESLIGIIQPANEDTLVLTTRNADNEAHNRVLSRLESDGKVYVAANHWPRAWYKQVLAQPEVQAEFAGTSADYLAVAVTGAEHDRVNSDNEAPFAFRLLTGFPPRYFIRLDPR